MATVAAARLGQSQGSGRRRKPASLLQVLNEPNKQPSRALCGSETDIDVSEVVFPRVLSHSLDLDETVENTVVKLVLSGESLHLRVQKVLPSKNAALDLSDLDEHHVGGFFPSCLGFLHDVCEGLDILVIVFSGSHCVVELLGQMLYAETPTNISNPQIYRRLICGGRRGKLRRGCRGGRLRGGDLLAEHNAGCDAGRHAS